jgi:cytochrome c556
MRLFALCCLVVGGAALAEEAAAPADIVKYRQASMKALGGHVKALGPLASGKVRFPTHVEQHARAVLDLARLMKDLFPKGTGVGVGSSEAKDTIWTDEKKFAESLAEMNAAAEQLSKAAAGADSGALKAALDRTNDACGSCHKPFRAAH